jgi:N-acetylneuraminic acid mutarotase
MNYKSFISLKRILLVFFVLLTANHMQGQSIKGAWENITNMPTARWFPGTAVCDGKIYVIGGNSSATTASLSVVEVYDPITDTWQVKTPMPTPRSQVSACTVKGKIYAIGGSSGPSTGWTPVANVDIYDPATDSWTKGADFPNARTEIGLVAVNDKIYAIGGIDGKSAASKSVDIYDPASNSWSKGADMITARGTMPACALDGKIYVFGGSNGGASNWNHYASAEMYDIATNSWSAIKDMPESRSHLTGCAFNKKIYAIGGTQLDKGMSYSNMASYNPQTNTWENEPSMITAREAFNAVVLDGKIFAIGGTQAQNGLIAFSNAEVFDSIPKVAMSEKELQLPAKQGIFIGKLSSPKSSSLKFTFTKNEKLFDAALFLIRNDSVFTAQNFGLNSNKEYQFEILAVSENKDSIKTIMKLKTYFKVKATFTAPNGFLLESSDKKVMLDVLSSKVQGNGFVANSDTIWKNMKNAVEPFNNIDLIFTSHTHACHFDAELLFNALKNNPKAISIMNADAKNAMATYFADNSWLKDRIFAPTIPAKSHLDTTISGIKIRLTSIPHAGTTILGINLVLDSIEFVHFDDYNNLTEADYKTIGFTQKPVDVALIGALLLNGEQKVIKETYSPADFITVSHIMNISNVYSNFTSKADELKALNYQVNIPRWPMEMFSYKKYKNRIWLTNINSAPEITRSFKDLAVETGNTTKVYIPKNTFKDANLDDVFENVITIDDKPLPEWATFDATTQNLVLTPTTAKNYTVNITATDNHLSFSNINFKLQVTAPNKIENIGNSIFRVYPNPAHSEINIENTGLLKNGYSVSIYNLIGEKIYSGNESKQIRTKIDLSKFSETVMFLKITSENINECHRIIRF